MFSLRSPRWTRRGVPRSFYAPRHRSRSLTKERGGGHDRWKAARGTTLVEGVVTLRGAAAAAAAAAAPSATILSLLLFCGLKLQYIRSSGPSHAEVLLCRRTPVGCGEVKVVSLACRSCRAGLRAAAAHDVRSVGMAGAVAGGTGSDRGASGRSARSARKLQQPQMERWLRRGDRRSGKAGASNASGLLAKPFLVDGVPGSEDPGSLVAVTVQGRRVLDDGVFHRGLLRRRHTTVEFDLGKLGLLDDDQPAGGPAGCRQSRRLLGDLQALRATNLRCSGVIEAGRLGTCRRRALASVREAIRYHGVGDGEELEKLFAHIRGIRSRYAAGGGVVSASTRPAWPTSSCCCLRSTNVGRTGTYQRKQKRKAVSKKVFTNCRSVAAGAPHKRQKR